MDLETKVRQHLETVYGSSVSNLTMKRLGKGVHGTAFKLAFETDGKQRDLILKTLFPAEFGHDHFSDRARVLLLAYADYNDMPQHVEAIDVVGDAPDRLISLKDAQEFFIFMKTAPGTPYVEDLDAILQRHALTEQDRERTRALARFLARLHQRRYQGPNACSLYRRRIRELVGHGECIMGIIDTYDAVPFASFQELSAFARKGVSWWEKLRDKVERLCNVHGDYHPGNIRFHGEGFTLLDRSRGRWGEAADDVSCLASNYIYYALKDRGCFEGPFAELCRVFAENYLELTGDHDLLSMVQPFFAFRILVIANPRFYPDDTPAVKRKLITFGLNVLDCERFDLETVPDYLI